MEALTNDDQVDDFVVHVVLVEQLDVDTVQTGVSRPQRVQSQPRPLIIRHSVRQRHVVSGKLAGQRPVLLGEPEGGHDGVCGLQAVAPAEVGILPDTAVDGAAVGGRSHPLQGLAACHSTQQDYCTAPLAHWAYVFTTLTHWAYVFTTLTHWAYVFTTLTHCKAWLPVTAPSRLTILALWLTVPTLFATLTHRAYTIYHTDTPCLHYLPHWHTVPTLFTTLTHRAYSVYHTDTPCLHYLPHWHIVPTLFTTLTHCACTIYHTDTLCLQYLPHWHTVPTVFTTLTH